MKRLDFFLLRKDPKGTAEKTFWGRSMPRLSISGPSGFGAGSAEIWDMDGSTYSFDQKVSRHFGKHSLKFGGRYSRVGGFRSNPENPSFSFQNKADFLANIASAVVPSFGSPPYKSRMYEIGFFSQDDWRVTSKLVLNLGLRYDFYSNNVSEPTTNVPVGFFNLTPPTDWRKFDFGPTLDPKKPYNNDPWVNLGPRVGFAYNPDGQAKTVFRGGFGVLFSPQMPAVVRQSVAHPVVPFRVRWSLDEARQLGLKFPEYADVMSDVVQREAARTGVRFPFSAINPDLQNPYAMHYQFNIQRDLSSTMMLETGYVGNRSVKFIMHRLINLPDRLTGVRPNPNVIFGGPYYVDNTQNGVYNAWQTSLRKRFAQKLMFEAHYTWGKGLSTQNGDIGAYYGSDAEVNIQDFYNPRADRGPNSGDATHRLIADWVYDLPRFSNGANPFLRHALGGWQMSGIVSTRSGEPITITQSCPFYHCRPDYVGGPVIYENWKEKSTTRCTPGARCSIQYLRREAFALVPVDPGTRIAIRPGNVGNHSLRGPSSFGVDLSLAKNFRLREGINLQVRTDTFGFLNHLNYGAPSTSLNADTFGEINSASGIRVIQLNARLSW
jgi:hypothetical protein